jgi:hypothetical protein
MTPEQLALLDRADQSITELPSRNQALVAGGIDSAGQTLNSAKLVSSSAASITTDKTDYAPGQIVTITGSGFQPNEQIDIYFHEFPEEYPDVFFSVVANQQGSFVTAEFAPQEIDLGRIFTLTAIGQSSGFTAQTSFKDARPNTVTVSGQNPNPVPAGSSVTFTVTVGFNGNPTSCTVDLNIAGLPAGASFVSFSQNPVTGSGVSSVNSTLTLSTATSLSAGNHGFTVTAASRSGCQNHPISSNGNGTLVVIAAANTATTTTVTSSANPSTYGQSVSFTATVAPTTGSTAPTGTVQFNINGTNYGSPVALSASGSNGVAASGLISTLTVAGSPHTIEAAYIPTGNFTTSTGTLAGGQVIEKATPTATLAVNNSPQTYSGSPQAATVAISVSSVPGTVSNVKYDGSATAPTNAGTYAVTADFVPTDSTNYNSLIGLSAGNFVIEKAGSTTMVTCGAGPFAYNGSPHTPCSASVTSPGGLDEALTVSYTNNVNAGTATANASYVETANYLGSSGSATFEIAKAATVTTVTCDAGPFTYNGSPHTPCSASVTGPELNEALTVNYTNNVNAGTATASASYTEAANYLGSSGSKNFEIAKADAACSVTGYNVTYTGNPHTATGSCTGVLGETLSGLDLSNTSHTNAGTYNDPWTFTDSTGNYNNTSGTVTDFINKANATINVSGFTGVYDGLSHGATGSATGVVDENLSAWLNLGAMFTNVPGGTAYWTFTGGTNYNDATGNVPIVINKRPASVTPDDASKLLGALDPVPLTTGTLSGFIPADGVTATYTRTPGETAGTYTISAALSPAGVLGNYNITYNTANFTITYGVCLLFDNNKAVQKNATIPIKLNLCDANAVNVSSSEVVLNAFNLVWWGAESAPDVQDSGNANPDNNFRYTGGSYMFNLSTKNLWSGKWGLEFKADGDPLSHLVVFNVR